MILFTFYTQLTSCFYSKTSKTNTCKARAWSENVNGKTFKELHKKNKNINKHEIVPTKSLLK